MVLDACRGREPPEARVQGQAEVVEAHPQHARLADPVLAAGIGSRELHHAGTREPCSEQDLGRGREVICLDQTNETSEITALSSM